MIHTIIQWTCILINIVLFCFMYKSHLENKKYNDKQKNIEVDLKNLHELNVQPGDALIFVVRCELPQDRLDEIGKAIRHFVKKSLYGNESFIISSEQPIDVITMKLEEAYKKELVDKLKENENVANTVS